MLHYIVFKRLYDLIKLDPLSSLSISSFANKAWRLLDGKTVENVYSVTPDTKFLHHCKSAYMGGIYEVYIPKVQKGNLYDVKSLYPFIMWANKMPIGDCIWRNIINLDDYNGFCYAKYILYMIEKLEWFLLDLIKV